MTHLLNVGLLGQNLLCLKEQTKQNYETINQINVLWQKYQPLSKKKKMTATIQTFSMSTLTEIIPVVFKWQIEILKSAFIFID